MSKYVPFFTAKEHELNGLVASNEELDVLQDLLRPVNRPGCPDLGLTWSRTFEGMVESAPVVTKECAPGFQPYFFNPGAFRDYDTDHLRGDVDPETGVASLSYLGRLTTNTGGFFLSEIIRRVVTRYPEMRFTPEQEAILRISRNARRDDLPQAVLMDAGYLLRNPTLINGSFASSSAAVLPSVALVMEECTTKAIVEAEIARYLRSGRIVLAIYGCSDNDIPAEYRDKPYLFRQLYLPTGFAFAPEIEYATNEHRQACISAGLCTPEGSLPSSSFPDGCFSPPVFDALYKGEPYLMAAYLLMLSSVWVCDPYYAKLTYDLFDKFMSFDWSFPPSLSAILEKSGHSLTPLAYHVLQQGGVEPYKGSKDQNIGPYTRRLNEAFKRVDYWGDLPLPREQVCSGPDAPFDEVVLGCLPWMPGLGALDRTDYRALVINLASAFPFRIQTTKSLQIPYYYKEPLGGCRNLGLNRLLTDQVRAASQQSYISRVRKGEDEITLLKALEDDMERFLYEGGDATNSLQSRPYDKTPTILRVLENLKKLNTLPQTGISGLYDSVTLPIKLVCRDYDEYVAPYRANSFRTLSTLFVKKVQEGITTGEIPLSEAGAQYLRQTGNLDLLLFRSFRILDVRKLLSFPVEELKNIGLLDFFKTLFSTYDGLAIISKLERLKAVGLSTEFVKEVALKLSTTSYIKACTVVGSARLYDDVLRKTGKLEEGRDPGEFVFVSDIRYFFQMSTVLDRVAYGPQYKMDEAIKRKLRDTNLKKSKKTVSAYFSVSPRCPFEQYAKNGRVEPGGVGSVQAFGYREEAFLSMPFPVGHPIYDAFRRRNRKGGIIRGHLDGVRTYKDLVAVSLSFLRKNPNLASLLAEYSPSYISLFNEYGELPWHMLKEKLKREGDKGAKNSTLEDCLNKAFKSSLGKPKPVTKRNRPKYKTRFEKTEPVTSGLDSVAQEYDTKEEEYTALVEKAEEFADTEICDDTYLEYPRHLFNPAFGGVRRAEPFGWVIRFLRNDPGPEGLTERTVSRAYHMRIPGFVEVDCAPTKALREQLLERCWREAANFYMDKLVVDYKLRDTSLLPYLDQFPKKLKEEIIEVVESRRAHFEDLLKEEYAKLIEEAEQRSLNPLPIY